ncbi:sensor histidine kinase [Massilia pseudoviolaceinigra]|uniref:sensor histidine kinase n=1 Tax=Massilia pseudoviolaceinigra TaxID=3057165 RepID=UPI0027966533|nr:HAMP domain-containing sensor histidine kinase [Massilia sp. CCM 9206]MDQ1919236.1 HAMP domain-containing sensor histidine kinase [Massilia sp. CCM 9206]
MKTGASLRSRMMAAFALFALATALCFSLFSVLFVYSVEDSFFDNMLRQEAAHQQRSWSASGGLAAPLHDSVTLHRALATFPADLALQLGDGVRNGEFFGERGRHYYVRQLALGTTPAYLVAEVSRDLVVRPRMPFILGFLAVSTLAILAMTLGIGYWLARRATAPLTRLALLVSGAEPGQLPRHFAQDFPDNEIGALARKLDEAMARIAAFIEREQHFTRDASHELRTPLAVIEGAAQLLVQQALSAQAADQLQRVRNAAAQMAQTVATLLSLAREELDASVAEPVALLPLVEQAVVQFAHLLDGKAVEVSVEVAQGTIVQSHRAALAILLSNLVSNAFGHTQQGDIRIYMEGGSLVVADSGPGIAPALHERLFRPGAKGEASDGFGLGLSIARRLGARVGIDIAIDSVSGGGTRARLWWPG